MRKLISKALVVAFTLGTISLYAQQPSLQYWRPNDQRGLNVFETSKTDTVEYEGFRVRIGGGFAMQFQGLQHSSKFAGDTLVDLGSNFTLPVANLNLNVQLYDGLRMHVRTYLSSRHHAEAWVKGGYMQMDKLDFIREGFLQGVMDHTTIRVGMDEYNYGDVHFRRTDNARAIFNPFVGNYIMDAFSTEPFGEITVQKSGFLGVLGATNGRLNQAPVDGGDGGMAVFGKLGYDDQINDDLRVRLTGSFYSSTEESTRDYLYNGDRAGARYYNVMEGINGGGSDFRPRFSPGYGYLTAIQVNPFVKYKGLEFFGVYETISNGNDDIGGSFTQLGAEVLYRFGDNEDLYLGGRFNSVSGEQVDGAPTQEIQRINVGGGWFLTRNVLAKVEYVTNEYSGDGWNGSIFQNGKFDGVMVEAVINF